MKQVNGTIKEWPSEENKHLEWWKKLLLIVVLAVISYGILFVCSRNSYLYAVNTNESVQSLFTISKTFMKGWVPYHDFFDQRGLLLYLIYGLGSLIDSSSVHGIYIMEGLFLTIDALLIYALCRLYVNKAVSFCGVLVSLVYLCMNSVFMDSGSYLQFAAPFMLGCIYILLKGQILENISGLKVFIAGFLGACLLFIDINFLAFDLIWIIAVCLAQLFKKKNLTALFSFLYYLMGTLVPVFIVVVYLLLNNSTQDFINLYLTGNFKMYASGMISAFKEGMANFKNLLLDQPVMLIILGLSLGSIVYIRKLASWLFLVISQAALLCLFSAGYSQGSLVFWPVILYGIFGIILVLWIFNLCIEKFSRMQTFMYVLLFISTACYIGYESAVNLDFENLRFNADDPILQLAEIVDKEEDHTLLNYGAQDLGLYTYANVIPENFYFQQLPYGHILHESSKDIQKSYLAKKDPNFVVTCVNADEMDSLQSDSVLSQNYHEIKQILDGPANKIYVLYQRNQ